MSLHYRFLQRTYDTVLRTESEYDSGLKFKDSKNTFIKLSWLTNLNQSDVVFFARSPLSPYAYSGSDTFLNAMVDVTKVLHEITCDLSFV